MLKFFQLFYCKKSMVSDHKLNIRWIHHYALDVFLKKINFFFFNSHLLNGNWTFINVHFRKIHLRIEKKKN